MTIQACVDELVMRGCDDWVNAAEVTSVVKFTGHAQSEDEIRSLSLKLIREVVQQGLMEIGDLPDEGRHLKLWPITSQESLDRVEHEWKALGRNPSLGEVCWLQNTDKGDALGEELFKEKESSS
jgi:hypothetical protein